MLVERLPQALAFLGALALGAWAYRRLRCTRRSTEVETLMFCIAAAMLLAPAVIVVLDQRDLMRGVQSASSHGPVTAADYHLALMPIGESAPDFTLPRLDDGVPVHLADLACGRPVVLVFGSFGCGYFCNRLDDLRQLHERFAKQAEFLFVYINNRHSEPPPLRVVADPSAPSDAPVNRLARIREGMRYFDVPLSCVVDTADDRVQIEYDAFPARLVIVDQASKIAFDSGSILTSGLNPSGAAAWLEEHAVPSNPAMP